MLTNATILRIDRASGHTADGKLRLVAGASIAVRCALDAISSRQRYALGAVLADADQVVYVDRADLGAAGVAPGDQVRIQIDESTGYDTAVVITLGDRVGPAAKGLSHLEIFMRRQPLA